ncbi:MAG: hypothetical protein ACJ785_00135 [Gemmatimonadaceae bacterium]
MKPLLAVFALAMSVVGAPAHAQQVSDAASAANRPALEKQFRQRLAKLAQQRIGLTDAQMAQLEQSNARYAPQLNQLAVQERDIRRQLRQELTSASQPNQQHVSGLLDASLSLQKQRLAIVESEQKDLARFMTPVQRARYIALQQQFRARARELAGQNRGREGTPRRGQPGSKRLP